MKQVVLNANNMDLEIEALEDVNTLDTEIDGIECSSNDHENQSFMDFDSIGC